jgi:hypothetical protein
MDLAGAVTEALDRLLAAGRVEVRGNGAWLATIEDFRYELRQQGDVLLLHLWSAESNVVRRVLRIEEHEAGRLALEVARFSRARPDRLEFVAAPAGRAPGRILREQFCARFRDLLARQFPDESLVSLTAAADLKHSLSGNYPRGILRADSRAWAVMGAAPGESAATYDGLLTFGLLWLSRARQLTRGPSIAGLRLFCPEGAGRVTAYRLQALSKSNAVEVYEYNPESWRARRLDADDSGNLDAWLAPRREIDAVLALARPTIERIGRMTTAPIEAAVIPNTRDVALRYRGLLFALWRNDGVFYGAGDPRRALTPDRQGEFEALVRELEVHRSPVATDTKHPLYRAQPERWLESLVAADPTRVDARLDARFFYSQVPALTVGDRGVMDAVAVTRNGRLAVIELKASEDLQLVLQAVDYWLRVRWHHGQQDFARYGYFSGVEFDPRPPLLFLVAPALHFHPASEIVLQCLDPGIEIFRVGVSEHWRRGVKVVLRQGRT